MWFFYCKIILIDNRTCAHELALKLHRSEYLYHIKTKNKTHEKITNRWSIVNCW
jgi:hypothetical protein